MIRLDANELTSPAALKAGQRAKRLPSVDELDGAADKRFGGRQPDAGRGLTRRVSWGRGLR